MGCSYHLLGEGSLIVCVVDDSQDDDGFGRYFEALISDPRLQPAHAELVIYAPGARVPLSTEGMRRVAAIATKAGLGSGRCAEIAIVATQLDHALMAGEFAHVLENLAPAAGTVKSFHDVGQALAWLGKGALLDEVSENFSSIIHDIETINSFEQANTASQLPSLHELLTNAPVVLYAYVLDLTTEIGELAYMSESSSAILGLSRQDCLKDIATFWSRVHPGDMERLQREDVRTSRENVPFQVDVRWNHPLRGEIWLRASSRPTGLLFKGLTLWAGYVVDVTREHELMRQFEAQARTDPLTGVLNRRGLMKALATELDRAKRHGSTLSVLLFDLDFFKYVNDQYGHQAGDAVLQDFARIVSSLLRSSDIIGRYGGEEFVVLLPETQRCGALRFGERVLTEIETAVFTTTDATLRITVSAGLASSDGGRLSAEELIRDADMALYQAKTAGRNRISEI